MIILVTGASAGIGEKTVLKYAAQGHKVIACARRVEPLLSLQSKFPECILPLALDVSHYSEVEFFYNQLPSSWKPIDILVNNAGLALGLEPTQTSNIADWDKVIDVNNKGLLYMTHTVLPHMLKAGKGHIINIGSVAGSWPYYGGNVYGASKAFVKQFSLNLRTDLFGTPIRVTNIEPGLVSNTEFSFVRFKGDTEKSESVYKNKEALLPEDIAESIYWVSMLPTHVNINSLEIMPTSQSFAGLKVSDLS